MNSSRYVRRLSLSLSLLLGACDCEPSTIGDGDGSMADATVDGANADGSGNTDGGNTNDGGGTDGGGNICERVVLTPQAKYPEVLIVQDISGSMIGARWTNTKAALANVGMALQDKLLLGLYYFPEVGATEHNSCELTTFVPSTRYVDVAPALDNGSAISTSLNAVTPFGGTPTAEALDVVVYPYMTMNRSGAPVGTPKYVILVTDGSPNCTQPGGDGDDTDHEVSQAATLLEVQQLYTAGVITYVVGYQISDDVTGAMNDWALAGGGQNTYINVTSQSTLTTALTGIAQAIVPCDYELETAPTNATYVRVELDGVTIPLNGANGWELVGTKTVRLVGDACDTLRDGDEHELDVAVECAPVIIE